MEKIQPNYGVILAAGEGKRMRPLTESIPKPMVLINGIPVIGYQLEAFKRAKISNVVVTLGHKGQVLQNYIEDGKKWGIRVTYAETGTNHGSAGSLFQALLCVPETEKIIIGSYGDELLPKLDLLQVVETHIKKEASITIIGKPEKTGKDFVKIAEDGKITSLFNEPQVNLNTGVFVFNREDILHYLSEEGDFFNLLSKGYEGKIQVHIFDGYWGHVSDLRDVRRISNDFTKDRLPVNDKLEVIPANKERFL